MSEDVNRLRPPRFLHADGIVRPFCVREAEGNKLLKEIEKGKYANSDTFSHYEVIVEKRDVLLLSDQRVMYCVKNDIFGGWQVRSHQQGVPSSESHEAFFSADRLALSLERDQHDPVD